MKIPPPLRGDPKYLAALPPFLSNEANEGRVRYRKRFDTPERYQAYMSRYYRLITELDEAVGRVVDELRAQGVLRQHADRLRRRQRLLPRRSRARGQVVPIRASPCACRSSCATHGCQRGDAGVTRDEFALNLDVAPTLVAAAGLPVPAVMQGQDLSPLYLEARPPAWRDEFFYEHPTVTSKDRIPSSQAVIGKEWKYIEWPEFDHRQLFDLKKDPGELQNLAGSRAHARQENKMREQLEALQQRARSETQR